jgi:TLC domain
MGACLTVEINTWFLILRRVLYKRKDFIHPIVTDVVSFFFYLTWIVIRMILYPLIMYIFVQMAVAEVQTTGRLWHWPMMFLPVHFFLCILNLKWSYDLFAPMLRRRPGATTEIARGL